MISQSEQTEQSNQLPNAISQRLLLNYILQLVSKNVNFPVQNLIQITTKLTTTSRYKQLKNYSSQYKTMPFRILIITLLLCGCCSITIGNNVHKPVAEIASIAYEPPQNIKAWNCTFCIGKDTVKTPTVFGGSDLQGYIVYQDHSLIIGFRGTQNPFDIVKYAKNNKPASYPNCRGCMIHSGFYAAWNLIRHQFLFALQKMMSLYRSITTVVFLGHGLGGVFATLAVPEIIDFFPIQPYIAYETFGQPRFANEEFSSYIQDLFDEIKVKGFRTVHYADLVSQMIPLGYYMHCPKMQIWCDQEMNLLDKCYDDWEGECSNSLTDYDPDDHPIEQYRKE